MDLYQSIRHLTTRLDEAKLVYAVIGGMAMALRGVQRATFDLDFLLMFSDLEVARQILGEEGYTCIYQSENVSHYQKQGDGLARVNVLHAFRGPSLSMLRRAERLRLGNECLLPVVKIEDLIGLKIQAAINDPGRAPGDWSDIYRLIIHAGESSQTLDWALVNDYLTIFQSESKFSELKDLYERHL